MYIVCYNHINSRQKGDMMTEFRYAEFGRRLKEWREALKPPLTQREMARQVGVTDGFIAHIETGRTLPGKDTLRALARTLGVSETEIFKEAGFLSEETPSDEDILEDPELRLFFRDEWNKLSDDEKDWFKGFVRMMKERRKEKTGN